MLCACENKNHCLPCSLMWSMFRTEPGMCKNNNNKKHTVNECIMSMLAGMPVSLQSYQCWVVLVESTVLQGPRRKDVWPRCHPSLQCLLACDHCCLLLGHHFCCLSHIPLPDHQPPWIFFSSAHATFVSEMWRDIGTSETVLGPLEKTPWPPFLQGFIPIPRLHLLRTVV